MQQVDERLILTADGELDQDPDPLAQDLARLAAGRRDLDGAAGPRPRHRLAAQRRRAAGQPPVDGRA